MAEEKARPIIIKKKKNVVGGGHHGGAWKVAYADFVTAMMAFFLLMWLLNATTEEQRKGIADYFSPTIPVHRTSGGGNGPFGGSNALAEPALPQSETGATADSTAERRQARGETGVDLSREAEDARLRGIADALVAKGGESHVADALLEHVRMQVTDEGLIIEVSDLPGEPLFVENENRPTERLEGLLAMIAEVIAPALNPVAIDEHLNAEPISRPAAPGWDLTAMRALAVRELLASGGIDQWRFARVAGEADRAPAFPDPRDARNRRTEIILLRMGPA